jgi:uracil-DNA glycosylase family 4
LEVNVSPEDVLKQVAQEVAVCQKCQLHFGRKRAVPGEGPSNAKIMFIGEGPGFYENEQGRPFVGAAGKFLEELLAGIGMRREQVFIGNVVKCRPPGNRDPLPEEIEACSNYLDRQIAAINPQIIVTLGRYSMAKYLPNAKISAVHGQSFQVNGRLLVPMYHPAAALHQPSLKADVERDFSRLPGLISKGVEAPVHQGEEDQVQPAPPPAEEKPQPKQLSLF